MHVSDTRDNKAHEAVHQRKAGAVLSYVALLVNAVVSFAYVPILLSFLTESEYGVYELIGSIIGYLSVMDMGLSTTLSRFYVRARERHDANYVGNLLAMSVMVYGVLTVLAVAVGAAIYFAIDPLFGRTFTEGELVLAQQMMLLVILNCAIVLPGNWFLALINANERFVFARSLSIVKYVMQMIVVVLVLTWQDNAVNVLIVQVALNAATVLCYAAYCRKLLDVRIGFSGFDRKLLRSLLAFSFFILLNMVFDQIFWKTGQVVLGAVSGAAAVAVYGIACKLITAGYMQVSTGVASVFLPKLTKISAVTDDMDEINGLFVRIGRLQAILVWGMCAAFIALGEGFIKLWAGAGFEDAYPAIVLLMLGLSISLVQNLGISILQAKNKMAFRSIVYIVIAIIDVVISIPISAEYGVIGCAATAAVMLFVGTGPIMNIYYSRAIGLNIKHFFREVLPLMVPAVLCALAVRMVMEFVAAPTAWACFVAEALSFCVIYSILLWAGWLNAYEKGLVRAAARKIGDICRRSAIRR